MHLAQELLTNIECSVVQVQQRRQEPWRWGVQWLAIGGWQYQLREVNKELSIDYSTVIQHLMQIGKVKKLSKWVLCELAKNFKNCCFEVLSTLILCNNNEPFLDRIVTCDRKWILYNHCQTTQWLDQEVPKHFPKPNLHHKKVMVTVWWSADCLIHYSFLNPGETITSEKYAQQINEIHQNCNTCCQHWSTERTQFFSTTAPYHTSHNQCFKSWTNWATKFCLIHRRPDLSPTDYHLFHLNNFLEGRCFHNQLLLLLLLSRINHVWLCATP